MSLEPEEFKISEARIKHGDSSWEGFKPTDILVSRGEALELLEVLDHQFIDYSHTKVHELIKRMWIFVGTK